MALSGKVEAEIEIQAPTAKFYNMFRKQLRHIPNISTEIVHEGDWENVGSVKHWECTLGNQIFMFHNFLFFIIKGSMYEQGCL